MVSIASSKNENVVFAPKEIPEQLKHYPYVFLSGSIEKGGTNWRSLISEELSDAEVTILNPHREDWDETWGEDLTDDHFRQQVNWELDMMEAADVQAVYFAKATDAPITLLEFGIQAKTGAKTVVCCPNGYKKKGNVQAVCEKYGIPFTENLQDFVEALKKKLQELGKATS